jgi:hypothetical protein
MGIFQAVQQTVLRTTTVTFSMMHLGGSFSVELHDILQDNGKSRLSWNIVSWNSNMLSDQLSRVKKQELVLAS